MSPCQGRPATLQLKAQHDLALLQVEHQEREARRTNLIEARKTYLLPLRDRLIPWTGIHLSYQAAVAQLQAAIEFAATQSQTPDLTQFTENVATWEQTRADASAAITNYIGQVSDSSLQHLLNDLWVAEGRISSELSSFLQDVYSPTADYEALAPRWQSMLTDISTERDERLLAISKPPESRPL